MGKSSKKKLFTDDYSGSQSSNYSSLQKSRSNMTTLERKESKSPKPTQPPSGKKSQSKHLSPEQLKIQLEQKITSEHQNMKLKEKPEKLEMDTQKTENKFQKFGIRVLPQEEQKSPKSVEQNENNINIEKHLEDVAPPISIDEVDDPIKPAPPIKKREKKHEEVQGKFESTTKPEPFQRISLNGSGIKRDEYGIPQELPSHMFNAAVAARQNRKSSAEREFIEDDDIKAPKRKGKAPSPPEDGKSDIQNFDEIQLVNDNEISLQLTPKTEEEEHKKREFEIRSSSAELKSYNSDSDMEPELDNHSSVNTIELNSSDITIHQIEEDPQNRKTLSTGDLTKIKKTRKSSTGTLERAQSLDISDSSTGMPKKRKGGRMEDDFDMESGENFFGKVMLNKEPRLSIILDGLNTFQRNRLKKSTEWGNLEDAILKLNQEDEGMDITDYNTTPTENSRHSLSENTPEFDAVVNKIKQIKKEQVLFDVLDEATQVKPEKPIKNQIWPTFSTEMTGLFDGKTHKIKNNEEVPKDYQKRQQAPAKVPVFPPAEESFVNNVSTDVEISAKENGIGSFRPQVPNRINSRQRVPDEVTIVSPPEEKVNIERVQETDTALQDEWDISTKENIMNTSPPLSLEIVDLPENREHIIRINGNLTPSELPKLETSVRSEEIISNENNSVDSLDSPQNSIEISNSVGNEEECAKSSKTSIRPEEVLSKIPLLNSMVKTQREEASKKPVFTTNSTDESKTIVTNTFQPNLTDITQNFLYTEQMNCDSDYSYPYKSYDMNVPDDIKVSRHSYGSLERNMVPQSDDAKTEDSLRYVTNDDSLRLAYPDENLNLVSSEESLRHVSNVSVTNGDTELHSLELTINEPSELYMTALEDSGIDNRSPKTDIHSKVTISTPDLIKNVTLAEALNTLNNEEAPKSATVIVERSNRNSENVDRLSIVSDSVRDISDRSSESNNSSQGNSTLTYVTEIKVTPTSTSHTNVSEVDVLSDSPVRQNGRNLDTEFENYVKSFESKLEKFETNIQEFDKNLDEFMKEEEPKSIIINEKIDEKEVHKIQEIAEEQLKKLPEMRFTTSSYEYSKIPEKRQSQIELLRSNFEKTPSKPPKPDPPKSRIPIATTAKTPPTSPERRDSRNLENENDKALLELMSSPVTSTPYSTSKYQIKPPNKNVTVTSIRSNSKIPSGLPTLGGSRPPIAPRRTDNSDGHVVHVSTNGGVESSFKQWVFNPSNITNVSVSENKHEK